MNPIGFCLSENIFSLLYFWRITLSGKVFLVGSFYVSILKISSQSLLACKVSVEKSTDSLIRIPLYVRNYFSLAAFKIQIASSAPWALLVPLVVCHIYPTLHDLVSFHWYLHIWENNLFFQPFSKMGMAADLLSCSGSGYHCAAELPGISGQTSCFGGAGGYAQQLCRVTNFLSYLCSVAKTYCCLGTQAGKN